MLPLLPIQRDRQTMMAKSEFAIKAIRYGTLAQFPLSSLSVGSDESIRVDIPAIFWLLDNKTRRVLFDCGFYRQPWIDKYNAVDLIRPDDAVRMAGIEPERISDIIISHVHFDHIGGVDLFPQAILWIQKEEFNYYAGPAWHEGRAPRGVDRKDIFYLASRQREGKLMLIDGDDREIMPGIRIYTGGRHTYASAFIRVEGNPVYVLASDNCYLFSNLATHSPVHTFAFSDHEANLKAQERMIALAGTADRVMPGHDALIFDRFPTAGRIAFVR